MELPGASKSGGIPDPKGKGKPLSTEEALAQLTSVLQDALEGGMTIVLEMSSGYRQKAIAAGFSAEAADLMAVDFHRLMLDKFFDAVK